MKIVPPDFHVQSSGAKGNTRYIKERAEAFGEKKFEISCVKQKLLPYRCQKAKNAESAGQCYAGKQIT